MIYAGILIRYVVDADHGGPVQFIRDHPGSPSRATLDRIFKGRSPYTNKKVLQLEKVLGWPKGTVGMLARKDFQAMLEAGVDPEFVEYARRAA